MKTVANSHRHRLHENRVYTNGNRFQYHRPHTVTKTFLFKKVNEGVKFV